MTQDLFSLDDRVALVTGSSRGLGFAIAQALGAAGAHVVLNARDEEQLQSASDALLAQGVKTSTRTFDVTDPEGVRAAVEDIERSIGPIDILVNNAGAMKRGPFTEYPVADFRRLLDVNLVGPFVVGQAVAAEMVKRRRGKIINIGSVMSQLGRPTISAYTASKGGIRLLTNGMCADLAPHGLQVNAIAPGYFKTELTSDLADDPEFSNWLVARTPAGRWGEVEELAGAAIFLASSASDFVNGQILFVDGGLTAVV
ncbi:MAG TPA: SDR family oxidoreductase [Egibacteraceae bacterium]|nr:SDR family oxidoreductase [Egibacteraceae bacterium]